MENEVMTHQQVPMSDEAVNAAFNSMVSNYDVVSTTPNTDAYMQSFMDMQLGFDSLSLDSQSTRDAIASGEGVKALAASSLAVDSLATAVVAQHYQDMLNRNRDEQDRLAREADEEELVLV